MEKSILYAKIAVSQKKNSKLSFKYSGFSGSPYKHEIKLGYACKCNWQQNITCYWHNKKITVHFPERNFVVNI